MSDLKYAAAALLALLAGVTVETHTQSEAMPTFEVASIKPPTRFCAGLRVGTGTVDLLDMTLADFAQYLGNNIVDRPVINRIDMTGRFTFHLEFPPAEVAAVLNGRVNNVINPSIFAALQEQLGLTLERATGPNEFLAIDSVERPSEN